MDLIDRQAAIDEIGEKADEIYKTKQNGATYPHDDFFQGMAYAEDVVRQLPSAEPTQTNNSNVLTNASNALNALDCISRQAAIDAVDSEIVSTNPEHFKSSEKFIKFMDDADIASFGKWQWANGFNTAVVASKIQLQKLPSAEPVREPDEWCTDCKEYDHDKHCCPRFNRVIWSALQDAEIVRCRDCKWKYKHNCTRAVELYIHDNDFCSWAERRTDG